MISESIDTILTRQKDNQNYASGSAQNIVDKDGFLKLLMAQMQHQDPLSPLDNSELLAQMAQFSSLEQMQNMNASLSSSLQWDLLFNQTINNTMATSLIGREVEAVGNELHLSPGGKVDVRYTLETFAKDVRLEILDSSGKVVYSERKEGVDSGPHDWTWDGRGLAGQRLPAGVYTLRASALDVHDSPIAVSTYRVGIVEAVTYDQGQAFLLVNGQLISLGDVQRIGVGG